MQAGYRNSIAWQKNQAAVIRAARLINELPRTVPFKKLSEQLFALITSVGANIAEGYSDFRGNEYQRYLKISLRSAYETDHWLTTLQALAEDGRKKIDTGLLKEASSLNTETIKILKKTIESIRKKRAVGKR